MARKKYRRKRDRQPQDEVAGLIIVAIAVLAGASLLFESSTGVIGGFLYRLQRTIAGEYALFVPFSLLLWGLRTMLFPQSSHFGRRALAVLTVIICILTAVHIHAATEIDADALLRNRGAEEGGGILGAVFSYLLVRAFGLVGTVVVLLSAFIISFLVFINLSLRQVVTGVGSVLRSGGRGLSRSLASLGQALTGLVTRKPQARAEDAKEVVIHDYQQEQEEEEQQPGQAAPAAIPPRPAAEQTQAEQADAALPSQPAQPVIVDSQQEETDEAYQLPPLNLLQKTVRLRDPQGRRDLVAQKDLLEETLASFGIEAKVVNVHRGPTITRFEIQPASGVKVSRIVNLADDLALSLAATGVRIEAPIPGKSAVGLEIANKAKATVYIREVLESDAFVHSPSKLTVALGKGIAGDPVIADLREIPHLLIAGATGAGKSVCLNAIITSLLFKAKPSELKLLLIDPKVVELNVFNGLPHLLCPVVTDPRLAAQGLKNIVKEMEHRYQLFSEAGTRDINRYNEIMARQGQRKLPYVIVVIDELADLMMTAATEVEDTVCRIAQKSRAAGIHLVVATQRPSVDVLTGVIKANLTSRIAFAVSSQADSRTILDMGGAEKLLGRGDMLYYPVGAPKPMRVQSAYISDEEVEKVVAHVLGQAGQTQLPRTEFLDVTAAEEQEQEMEADELLPDAARMILESGQASISMLQRRLRIGYTRAARLIDDMEQLGIVGGFEGSKARKILVSPEQLEDILQNLDAS